MSVVEQRDNDSQWRNLSASKEGDTLSALKNLNAQLLNSSQTFFTKLAV